MDFEQLAKIENESERINKTYDIFNEDSRLNHSKAARVEFLTTIHYIEKYLKEGDRILDIGAGAGEYSFYFARKGYDVSALELADANIAAFRKKLSSEDKIDLVQGNALDLSCYEDKSFDIVLLFPMILFFLRNLDMTLIIFLMEIMIRKHLNLTIFPLYSTRLMLQEISYLMVE